MLVDKWRQEALDQQKDEYRIQQLTKRMATMPKSFTLTRDWPRSKIDYVFQELHGYATIRDPDTGVEVGPHLLRLPFVCQHYLVRSAPANASGDLTL